MLSGSAQGAPCRSMKFKLTRNLVDVVAREIYPACVTVADGVIAGIQRVKSAEHYLLPGFVDSHIHVESSMLLPSEFARIAVVHGTVATVSDPHEIANVCGVEGVELMLRNAAQVNFKFCFGAPSCVPATKFETAGAELDVDAVTKLLKDDRIGYLSEVMDFPGVLQRSPDVMAKIDAARSAGKPVDGHAPGLRGEEAANYFAAGISTDHECFTLDEALDKIKSGCKIAIREGSAARNFEALQTLLDDHPDSCMLCSDDKHPDEFLLGHINQLVARAIAHGRDLMNVLQAACLNPVRHYGLDVGLLQVGDPADFIEVTELKDFKVEATYIDGVQVSKQGECLIEKVKTEAINNFHVGPIEASSLRVPAHDSSSSIRTIEAMDGQLITNDLTVPCSLVDGCVGNDIENDVLKIVVVNRYHDAAPAIAFIKGFGLSRGALASSVAHDSHNIVAVGATDQELEHAINAVIETQGGLSVSSFDVAGSASTLVLPLPVAGLMSTDDCQTVGKQYSHLDKRVKEFGCQLRAPFMTLSFMALLVIPSLKLSDRGLFDAQKFEFASLAVAE